MASVGFSRPWDPNNHRVLAALLLILAPLPCAAQTNQAEISIPETTLDVAMTALARQSGDDIISTEPGLARVRVQRVAGRMSVRSALDRLLAGSGYRAVAIDAHSFRIVRAPSRRTEPRQAPKRRPPPAPGEITPVDIVVTGSKQQLTLLRFPGSVVVAGGLIDRLPGARSPDMDELARSMPILQNTELGAGRNKIFIRGIADSSFNGATQSTASIYFGEVQLGYSGPEPNLDLNDIQSVEILEGPQGTLYGAGAIGGIIRVTPNPVNLTQAEGAAGGGLTATSGGTPGFDFNAMINLPIVKDSSGLRVTGYREHDGGYIDDSGRGLADVNNTDTVGGRIAFRLDPGDGWSIDLGGLAQRIDAADAQYAEGWVGPLRRNAEIAQPFHSAIGLGRAVLTKKWDSNITMVSATGVVDNHSSDTFDATRALGSVGRTVYNNNLANLLVTHETRFSRSIAGGISWVTGIALLYDRDVQSRRLGPPGDPTDIIGVTNVTKSASLFAEATLPLSPSFSVTPGARLTWARTDGEPSTTPRAADFVLGRSTKRVDPTIGISWLIAPRLAAFGRFQSGYRTGGLAVARGVGRVADYQSDSISLGEVGLRLERRGSTGLALSTSLSLAHWDDIQADLVNRRGQPYTANIGNAEIVALEGRGNWVPVPGLNVTGAFLFTHNRVEGLLALSSIAANRQLPETPSFAGNVGLAYHWSDGGEGEFRLGATARYVGRSVLGSGDYLDISQGRYTVAGLSGGWRWRRFDTSLTVDNLTNKKDNRFAMGNPFLLGQRDLTTPLRPMNVRLGFGVTW